MSIENIDLTSRLKGKVAVITGGASGIGLATAKRMRAEGATIVIADMDPKTGEAAAKEVEGTFIQVNVADEEQVNHLFDETARLHGSVDIAFNNAGISPADDDSIETTELPAWQKVQDVNLKSVYLCCRAALRHMTKQGSGSIINTASFVAVMGSATSQISYTASKGGVLAMSRELGVQFARQGIRVNALSPGSILFPGGGWERTRAERPEDFATFESMDFPWGRLGTAEEVADVVAFLASPRSRWINGADIHVDGGQRRPSIR